MDDIYMLEDSLVAERIGGVPEEVMKVIKENMVIL